MSDGSLRGGWCTHCYVFVKSDTVGRLKAHPLRGGECPGSRRYGFGTVPTGTPPCDRPSSQWSGVIALGAVDPCADLRAERDAALSQAEELTRALADGRVELRQRADDAERVAADLRDDLERLRAAVREADEAAQHVYAASVAERIGQPYAAAKVAAIIARQDAACAALRALMPTEVSRG